jgi:uncharacterized membrane protein
MDVLLLESGHYGGPWWPGLILLLTIAVFLALVFFNGLWASPRRRGRDESAIDVLRRRLALGQINEEEYQRLRNLRVTSGAKLSFFLTRHRFPVDMIQV